MKRPTILSCLGAGPLAFFLTSVAELGFLSSAGRIPHTADEGFFTSLGHALGVNGIVGALTGVGLALVLPATSAVAAPWAFFKGQLWPLSAKATEGATLNRTTAAWVASLASLLPVAAAAFLGGQIAHGFNQGGFAGPFTALAALAGVGAGLALWSTVFLVTKTLFNRVLPSGRLLGLPTPALPLLGLLAAFLLVVSKTASLDLGSMRPMGLISVVGSVALAALLAIPLARIPKLTAALGLIPALALGNFAVFHLGDAPGTTRLLAQDAELTRVNLDVLRRLLDRDRDGASFVLAGGDCDDTNREIGPHVKEIPGNGIDDNCLGGDAPKDDIAATPPPKPAAPVDPTKPHYEPKRHNVLFVVVDTMRPDHLGAYGYKRDTSPNIDRFAKDAVVFERVYAQGPHTPRSFPSIFTGRYPSRVKWVKRFARFSGILPENQTLFETFQQGGWRTEAVSSHWYWEDATGIKDGVDAWDNQGFTTIKESNTQVCAHEITPRVVTRLDALAKQDKPFMMFVHYFEPHGKYMAQTIKSFGDSSIDKYDSEIAYVDHYLKPVFEALERNNLYENTIVIVASDHGEAFKEHGFYFHGRTVYDEELRVPLIIRMPGVAPKREKTTVGLLDLYPTLAELTGLTAPDVQGLSFAPLLTGFGELPQDRVLFLEQIPYPGYEKHVVGAIQGDTKAIRNLTDNVTEVFDLAQDPGEKTNLIEATPDAGAALLEKVGRFVDADPGE